MSQACLKRKKTQRGAACALAAALVLIFNGAMPSLVAFHDGKGGVRSNQFRDHHSVAQHHHHHDHPPHTHRHTHSDGSTHEHQHHDEHCFKIGSNSLVCAQLYNMVPTGTWSLLVTNSARPNFAFSGHYAELLRPPILA